MIRSLALAISFGSVLATCGLGFAQEDLSKARQLYTDCKEKLDAGEACDALALCENGLEASSTEALVSLTSDAKAACDQEKAKAAEADRAKKEKEEKAKSAFDEVASSGVTATGDSDRDEKKKKKKGSGKVKPGRFSTSGMVDKKVIKRVVTRSKSKIAACYEAALQSDPSLAGKVVINWTIGGTGSVLAASVASDSMGSTKVSSCLVRVVKGWKFPAPLSGGVVKVSYPFSFEPE